MVFFQKGDHVQASWFECTNACIPGTQLKIGAKLREVRGVITHVRGDVPVDPTSVRIWIQPDGGGAEVVVRPEWCRPVEKTPEEG